MYVKEKGGILYLEQEVVDASLELGKGHPVDKVAAVKIGASVCTPQAYAKCPDNIAAAIHNRITLKKVPFAPTVDDKRRMTEFIDKVLDDKRGIFTRAAITEWARNNPLLDELKSSKWSPDRLQNAVNRAFLEAKVEVNFGIKLEALPDKGKAPRLLIADGDVGQLLSLMSIKCFEDILFARYKDHAIKHVAPIEGLRRILERMRQGGKHEQDVCEGDGTAWDTCCSLELRQALENRILWKITAIIMETTAFPTEWFTAAMKPNELKKLKSKCKHVDPACGFLAKSVLFVIDSIRRSGHRGTSCLNWWSNHCLWVLSFAEEPHKVINPNTRRFRCRWGGKDVFYDYLFEGDDSYITSQNLRPHVDELTAFWTRMGFNMKFNWCDPWSTGNTRGGVTTVIGFNVLCDKYGPCPDEIVPEPKRGMVSSAWSVSNELRNSLDKGCPAYHRVAASSYLARYNGMAGCFPELAAVYRSQAVYHLERAGKANILREEQMKIYGKADEDMPMQAALAQADALRTTRSRADRLLHALHLECSAAESAAMLAIDTLGPADDQLLRLAIPQGWNW